MRVNLEHQIAGISNLTRKPLGITINMASREQPGNYRAMRANALEHGRIVSSWCNLQWQENGADGKSERASLFPYRERGIIYVCGCS